MAVRSNFYVLHYVYTTQLNDLLDDFTTHHEHTLRRFFDLTSTLMAAGLTLLFTTSLAVLVATASNTQLPTDTVSSLVTISGGHLFYIVSFVVLLTTHELAHALAYATEDTTITELGVISLFFLPVLGYVKQEESEQLNRLQRRRITSAGVGVNYCSAAVSGVFYMATGISHFESFAVLAVVFGLVNSLPIFFLDGDDYLEIISDTYDYGPLYALVCVAVIGSASVLLLIP